MPRPAWQGGGAFSTESGFDYSTTKGTALTAGGSAHVLGSVVELLSAADNLYQSSGLTVIIFTDPVAEARFQIVLTMGADDVPFLWDLYASESATTADGESVFQYNFPIGIPSGVKIGAQVRSTTASEVATVAIIRSVGGAPGYQFCYPIGSDPAATAGTTVARTSSNTFGGWVEMDPSIPYAIKGFAVAGIKDAGSWSEANISYQVGVGAAGEEIIIRSGDLIRQLAREATSNAVSPFVPVGVAAGQRIAMRAQSSVNDIDSDLDYIIYGVA